MISAYELSGCPRRGFLRSMTEGVFCIGPELSPCRSSGHFHMMTHPYGPSTVGVCARLGATFQRLREQLCGLPDCSRISLEQAEEG